mmetsp:Transcript_44408/g.121012  ORF Transcript_44408/g.121012 Transcript_44408/m.121012 type:complete len:232 (+) Transcript_44408:26-721(+)
MHNTTLATATTIVTTTTTIAAAYARTCVCASASAIRLLRPPGSSSGVVRLSVGCRVHELDQIVMLLSAAQLLDEAPVALAAHQLRRAIVHVGSHLAPGTAIGTYVEAGCRREASWRRGGDEAETRRRRWVRGAVGSGGCAWQIPKSASRSGSGRGVRDVLCAAMLHRPASSVARPPVALAASSLSVHQKQQPQRPPRLTRKCGTSTRGCSAPRLRLHLVWRSAAPSPPRPT